MWKYFEDHLPDELAFEAGGTSHCVQFWNVIIAYYSDDEVVMIVFKDIQKKGMLCKRGWG